MTALEDALARALADRIDVGAPALFRSRELADRAIRAGRRQRRLRATGAGAAGFVVCAVVAAAMLFGAGVPIQGDGVRPGTFGAATYITVSTAADRADVPVDYVSDNQLYLRDGRTFELPGSMTTQIRRAGDGFLFVTDDSAGSKSAWYLNGYSGSLHNMVARARTIVVGGNGRIATLDPRLNQLRAVLDGQPYVAERRSEDPFPNVAPVGFVGAGMLLADRATGRYGVWFPDSSLYWEEPIWSNVLAVYGSRARGTEVVASRLTDRGVCLAVVPVTDLGDDRNCHLIDQIPLRGWVSPSGRWLVLAGRGQAQMLDLTAGWRVTATFGWSVDRVDPDAAWLDQDRVAVNTSTGVVVLAPFGNDKAVAYPALPPESVIVNQ